MSEMDLKTRIEVLPCGKCEDMVDCDTCLFQKEAKEIYKQIRADAIDEFIRVIGERFSEDKIALIKLGKIAEELKEQNNDNQQDEI